MLTVIVARSIHVRFFILALLVVLLLGGGAAARYLPIDAVPDVSTVQVSVLTDCPGLSPVEVERTVTFPMETALNGVPQLVELRSVSRRALRRHRHLQGRHRHLVRAPDGARARAQRGGEPPEDRRHARAVAGLRRPRRDLPVRGPLRPALAHAAPHDARLGDRPEAAHGAGRHRGQHDGRRPQAVPGGRRPRPAPRPRADAEGRRGALARANVDVGGGYLDRAAESFNLAASASSRTRTRSPTSSCARPPTAPPLLVRHVAQVKIGAALRHGVITRNGEGEAVTGVTMMLIGVEQPRRHQRREEADGGDPGASCRPA